MAMSVKKIRLQTRKKRGRVVYQPAPAVKQHTTEFGPLGLKVTGRVKGTSGQLYRVDLLFPTVDTAVPGQAPGTTLKTLNRKGKAVRVVRPTDSSSVRIRCSCEDFKFTWSESLRRNDSLLGKPFDFSGVQGTGKPRNPEGYYGMCKHVNTLLHVILKE